LDKTEVRDKYKKIIKRKLEGIRKETDIFERKSREERGEREK
jgi:hypothetical protein